ncbi:MAG: nicotinate-nucleotide adenylyltransferase [Betaproteobacteria bacterium]|nr:nicotinate-nucleotide adenylyltransferase [Betaproteobacteria bacterium]
MDETGPIGILGGTFDPVHYGHLRLAEEAADALGLTQVRLIPAALPNLRARPGTKPHQRLEMTRLAAAHNPRLAVDDRELRREGMSYTVDTLDELRAELGATRPIWLILGADAFLRLPAWSRWLQLFDLAHIAVATRPGYTLDEAVRQSAELAAEWHRRFVPDPVPPPPRAGASAGAIVPSVGASAGAVVPPCANAPAVAVVPRAGALADAPAGAIVHLPIPLLEISASDLRVRMSRGASVRYLLPPAVIDYIAAHRLYPSQ